MKTSMSVSRKGQIHPVGAKLQKKPPPPTKPGPKPPPRPAARGDAISGGKLLKSQAPRTRALRKSVIEDNYGNAPIRGW